MSRDIVTAHSLALNKATAKYFMRRAEVKPFTINAGTQSADIDHVKSGILPYRIFVTMVTNKAFIGTYNKNPYNFQHFNCNYICCIMNGEQYPLKGYSSNFKDGLYTREYIGLLEALEQCTSDAITTITRDSYVKGNVIYGFTLAPDLSQGFSSTGYVNAVRRGYIGLEIKFVEALSETITVLVYCEYDSAIEIDNNREVFVDYLQQ